AADARTNTPDRLHKPPSPKGLDMAPIPAAPKKETPLPAELRVLLVPCLLGNFLVPLRAVGISAYLDSQASALEGVKARVERSRINTQASAFENARRIEAEIARGEGPVCLISHSKGGIDVLQCLLKAPSLWRRIA